MVGELRTTAGEQSHAKEDEQIAECQIESDAKGLLMNIAFAHVRATFALSAVRPHACQQQLKGQSRMDEDKSNWSQADRFHRAYGLAMLCWQHVEVALFRVYFSTAGAPLEDAQEAYYSTREFGQKLELTKAAAKNTLTGEHLAEWQRLHSRTKPLAEDRNAIAHLPAAAWFPEGDEMHLALAPPMFAPASLRRKRPRIDLAKCLSLADDFRALGTALAAFSYRPSYP